MSTQITARPTGPTLAQQTPAFDALAALTETFGHLPIPYVTVHVTLPAHFDLQLGSPQGFEQWREALDIDSALVELHSCNGAIWLSADCEFHGVRLNLSGFNVPLTDEATNAVAA